MSGGKLKLEWCTLTVLIVALMDSGLEFEDFKDDKLE